jgi:hypothetical protein
MTENEMISLLKFKRRQLCYIYLFCATYLLHQLLKFVKSNIFNNFKYFFCNNFLRSEKF